MISSDDYVNSLSRLPNKKLLEYVREQLKVRVNNPHLIEDVDGKKVVIDVW